MAVTSTTTDRGVRPYDISPQALQVGAPRVASASTPPANTLDDEFEAWKARRLVQGQPVSLAKPGQPMGAQAARARAHQLTARGVLEGLRGIFQSALGAIEGDPLKAALPFAGIQPPAEALAGAVFNPLTQNLPEPQTALERMGMSGIAGATGGLAAGPAGIVPGLVGGSAAAGVGELGGGPLAQIGAGLAAGGLTAAGQAAGMSRTPQARAARAVSRQIERSGERAIPAIEEAALRMDDVGREALGRPGQELAMQVAAEGGPAGRQVVASARRRVGQVASQFITKATKLLGGRRGDQTLEQALIDEQRAVTEPLYRAIERRPVRVTPELAQLLDDPVVEAAYNRGRQVFQTGLDPQTKQPRFRLPELRRADGQIQGELPLAALNQLKKGLDDLVGARQGSETALGPEQARAASQRVSAIRDMVDQQIPEYAQARELSRAYFRQRDMLDFGRRLLDPKTDDVEVRQALMGRTATEVGLVKAGLADALARKPGAVASLPTNPQLLMRLRQLLPEKDYNELIRLAEQAQDLSRASKQVVSAGRPKLSAEPQGRIRRAVAAVALRLFRSAGRDVAAELSARPTFPPDVRQELAALLTAEGGDLQAQLDALRTALQEPSRVAGAGALGALTGTVPQSRPER